MPFEQTHKVKIILFMPEDLQPVYSTFLQTILRYPKPIFCSTISSLKKSYISNRPAIIITIYYRLLNQKIHERLLWFANVYYGNIVVMRHDINLYEREWASRLLKAIQFFCDANRPLASIVTIGIDVSVYLDSPLTCEYGNCIISANAINTAELISYGRIYKFKLFDEDDKHARVYRSKMKNHLRLVPDIQIGSGSLIPVDHIPLEDITILGRVTHEYWQF